MNQARMGLLVGMALVSFSMGAHGQGKPKKPGIGAGKKAPVVVADTPGIAAPETEKKDSPAAETATDTASDVTPAAPSDTEEVKGICDIDPSQCPQVDLNAAARRTVSSPMYAVQQIYALRARRFEINPYWAFTLNDQFVNHPGPGLSVNYYLTNVLAIGANFNFYRGLNQDSSFNAQSRRAARISVPLTEYDWSAALNFTYVPMYGKFAGFQDFIFHYDAYVVGGVGGLANRPIAVVDPDNRSFGSQVNLAFNAGLGLRVFFNRWFAATLEVRDYIFVDKLENTRIVAGKEQDEATWYGDKKLTNNVQAQLGISVFLPFSWEYRLPK
jgi:outer membrane beta-barrel protein